MARKRLTTRRKLAMTAVTLALGVLLCEGVLRLLGFPKGLTSSAKRLWATDDELAEGWFRPDASARIAWPPELPYTVHTNALGLRGPAPTPGRPLVLCLGDSTTFGSHVEDDQTYPARLGAALAARAPGCEVVNAGCPNTTITDQLVVLARLLPKLKPQVVVLLFCGNDLADLDSAPARERALKRRSWLADLGGALALGDAVAWTGLRLRRAQLQAEGRWPVPLRPDQGRTERQDEARWQAYASHLGELRVLVEKAGAKLILSGFPGYLELADPSCEIERRLPELAAAQGVPYVDLYAPLRGQPAQEVFLLPHDAHASPHGNELIAAALAPSVLERLTPP